MITAGKLEQQTTRRFSKFRINIRPVKSSDAAQWLRMRLALWPDNPEKEAAEIAEFINNTVHKLAELHQAFVCALRQAVGLVGLNPHTFAAGCEIALAISKRGMLTLMRSTRRGTSIG